MRRLLILPTLLLGGCCCCGFGGGGGSSAGGGLGDRMGEAIGDRASEAVAEGIWERATGLDIDISAGGQRITAETPEGTLTTLSDGTLPEGLPWTVPPGVKVTMSSRMDPKEAGKGGPTWVVSYETTEAWQAVARHWQSEAEARGYTVVSSSAAMKAALAQAEAQGMPATAVDMPAETGDMLAFESADPNKSGAAIIDGSTPGKTTVILTVR